MRYVRIGADMGRRLACGGALFLLAGAGATPLVPDGAALVAPDRVLSQTVAPPQCAMTNGTLVCAPHPPSSPPSPPEQPSPPLPAEEAAWRELEAAAEKEAEEEASQRDFEAAAAMHARLSKRCTHVYLGFSNGHVGTTTLASREVYKGTMEGNEQLTYHHTNYAFAFEKGFIPVERYLAGISDDAIDAHVADTYLPQLEKKCENVHGCVCVDMSHVNLFFIDGLIRSLARRSVGVTLIRIRRPSDELALSLSEHDSTDSKPDSDCAKTSGWHYCPFANGDSGARVVLKLPRHLWRSFSSYQRALWEVDEVQAQWRRLHEQWSNRTGVRFDEVSWSMDADDFATHTLAPVARILGLKLASGPPPQKKQHLNGHTACWFDHASCSPDKLREIKRDDRKRAAQHEEYRKKMAPLLQTLPGIDDVDHSTRGT